MSNELNYYLADVEELIPYARNARTHSSAQITQIAASIKEFGFLAPIVIAEDNTILCGHGRFTQRKTGLKENTLRQGITPHRGAETRIYHRRQ